MPCEEHALGQHGVLDRRAGHLVAALSEPRQHLGTLEPALPGRAFEVAVTASVLVDDQDAAAGLHHPQQLAHGGLGVDGVL